MPFQSACSDANITCSPHLCWFVCLSLMLPCCCDTNQDSALGLWPVHSSTSLWFWAGVLDTLFSPFLVIFLSLNLWHDYVSFQSRCWVDSVQEKQWRHACGKDQIKYCKYTVNESICFTEKDSLFLYQLKSFSEWGENCNKIYWGWLMLSCGAEFELFWIFFIVFFS